MAKYFLWALLSAAASVAVPPKAFARHLPRIEVSELIDAARPSIRACFSRFRKTGEVDTKFRVLTNGRVRDLLVQGVFAETAEGACIAAALTNIKWPANDQEFIISYRFQVPFPAFGTESIDIRELAVRGSTSEGHYSEKLHTR